MLSVSKRFLFGPPKPVSEESSDESYEEFIVSDWKKSPPFKLSLISNTGFSCATCESPECHGCALPYNESPLANHVKPFATISVDWENWVLRDHYDREEATVSAPTTKLMH